MGYTVTLSCELVSLLNQGTSKFQNCTTQYNMSRPLQSWTHDEYEWRTFVSCISRRFILACLEQLLVKIIQKLGSRVFNSILKKLKGKENCVVE